MKFRGVFLLGIACTLAACNLDKLPTASTPIAAPAPPLTPPPLPTTVPGVLSIAMPIDGADVATTAFGLMPFGYHGGGHTEDGHAGWDIEYRVGAPVRAAAMGTVIAIAPDPISLGRTTVVLEHLVGAHFYRTHYSNLASVSSDVALDAVVLAGQAIGIAGTVTATMFNADVTYAMTHFQLDDLEFHREVANPKAVSPEPFLSAAGKSVFDRIWTSAVYFQEAVEPLATNPRETVVTQRTWMRAGGDGPAGIRFTRRGNAYTYELLAESGTVIETGTATLRRAGTLTTIDLISPTAIRLGVFDIVSNEMRLSLANPGITRPADLAAASIYRTQ
ncbi:MAG TPA: M23 family metallopeptidase [Vicinamibacterales bacterium]|nr:M23 family metallopeptidase [Vicinamibacterales bacterium]